MIKQEKIPMMGRSITIDVLDCSLCLLHTKTKAQVDKEAEQFEEKYNEWIAEED
jgi:hypothetical protein